MNIEIVRREYINNDDVRFYFTLEDGELRDFVKYAFALSGCSVVVNCCDLTPSQSEVKAIELIKQQIRDSVNDNYQQAIRLLNDTN